jgi:hypothetical protein
MANNKKLILEVFVSITFVMVMTSISFGSGLNN